MAAKPARLTLEAREELLQAIDHYDEQALLGRDLLSCVEDCIARIREAPMTHSPERGFEQAEVRSGAVKRFPYRLVFVEDSEELRILAVAHKSRRPGYWRSRLSGE